MDLLLLGITFSRISAILGSLLELNQRGIWEAQVYQMSPHQMSSGKVPGGGECPQMAGAGLQIHLIGGSLLVSSCGCWCPAAGQMLAAKGRNQEIPLTSLQLPNPDCP